MQGAGLNGFMRGMKGSLEYNTYLIHAHTLILISNSALISFKDSSGALRTDTDEFRSYLKPQFGVTLKSFRM